MISVRVNGQEERVEPGTSVAELIQTHTGQASPLGVAVARNKDVVPRSAWADTRVEDGDELELVGVMQGG